MKHLAMFAGLLALSATACTAAKNGTNGSSCTVTPNADGSATISCTDGTTTTVQPGTAGAAGAVGASGAAGATGATGATGTAGVSCTVAENADAGTSTITCPGSSATVSDGLPPCSTLSGDLNITGALDIVAFQAAGCTTINGNLNIIDNPEFGENQTLESVVGDLSGFSNLTTVKGNVDIEGDYNGVDDTNDLLQAPSLHGFQNLATVGGYFYVGGTTWATDADLASLTTVTGSLYLGWLYTGGNAALQTIELPLLTSANGLYVDYDESLTALTLPVFATDGGKLEILNSELASLSIPTLTSIGNDVHFKRNGGDSGTPGGVVDLSGVQSVGGDILFEGNTQATGLNLSSLTLLADNADIEGNTDLADLNISSMVDLTDGGTYPYTSLYITSNPALATIELTDLTTSYDLEVENTVATSLAFPALTTITDGIWIDDNADLAALTFGAEGTGPVAVTTAADVSNDPDLPACASLATDFTGVTATTSSDAACP